jgi:DNA polymerase V
MNELNPEQPITFHKIVAQESPVLTGLGIDVQAGFPSPAGDYLEEEINLNHYLIPRPNSTFIVRVKGDSMLNAHIPDNSLLVVDKSVKPVNNRIVVAIVDNEFTVKRFIKNSSGIRLLPESPNPKYRPIPITDEMDFRIWGTVTNIIINAARV